MSSRRIKVSNADLIVLKVTCKGKQIGMCAPPPSLQCLKKTLSVWSFVFYIRNSGLVYLGKLYGSWTTNRIVTSKAQRKRNLIKWERKLFVFTNDFTGEILALLGIYSSGARISATIQNSIFGLCCKNQFNINDREALGRKDGSKIQHHCLFS